LILAGPSAGSVGLDRRSGSGERSVLALDRLSPVELREVYAACDVLVVPSIPTRTFREPWGLVVNEAMNGGLAVIATDAVGAAAGGLVRDGESGLVVGAGDVGALSAAISRLAQDEGLRERLGAAGAREVAAYSHEAWAEGFSRALSSLGLSRERW
jgi:glycosyltransferase involved in cell wall biosynthesis